MRGASDVAVVVIGHTTLDDRFDPGSDTPTRQPGGATIYAALGAAIWGSRVGIVTLVGSDYPEAVLTELAMRGIDVTGVHRTKTPSISGSLRYDASGERDVTDLDMEYVRYMSPTPADVPSAYRDVEHFHLAAMSLRQQLDHASSLAAGRRTITLDTAPHYFGSEDAILPILLRQVTLFCPSIADLEAHVAHSGVASTSLRAYFEQLGIKRAIVKMGSRGAVVFSESYKEPVLVPAYPTRAIDPTGAGDAFCGGMLASLARGDDVLVAAAHGSVSASFVIETEGAWFPTFTEAERATRLDSVRGRSSAWNEITP